MAASLEIFVPGERKWHPFDLNITRRLPENQEDVVIRFTGLSSKDELLPVLDVPPECTAISYWFDDVGQDMDKGDLIPYTTDDEGRQPHLIEEAPGVCIYSDVKGEKILGTRYSTMGHLTLIPPIIGLYVEKLDNVPNGTERVYMVFRCTALGRNADGYRISVDTQNLL